MTTHGSLSTTPRDGGRPHWIEWVVVVGALIIQQNAFVLLPFVIAGESFRGVVNPLNTIAVWASLASILGLCAWRVRSLARLGRQNVASVAFVVLVVASTIWSIHPDATIRRGVGYVLTLLVAAFLCVRFDSAARMRALSWSFAVSAIGSLAFVVLLPQFGIMQVGDLTGAWRGVFPHKNVLGPVMAVAIFVEAYLLVVEAGRRRWRFALLALYVALMVLSHSATAMLLSLLYSAAAGGYLLWKRHRVAAAVVVMNGVLALTAAVVALWSNPSLALTAIGKDPTLTGRTTLWSIVVSLIQEKPWLGWGYRAMWLLDDPTTAFADAMTGHWGITSAHNGFLELTLELGLVGLGAMLLISGVALWRAIRCCRAGASPLGWFSLVFIAATLLAAGTVDTLGQNQDIAWVVFNVLLFGCGLELLAARRHRVGRAMPAPPVARRGDGPTVGRAALVRIG